MLRRYALPIAWAAAAALILTLQSLPPTTMYRGARSDDILEITYSVAANEHDSVSLMAACGVFAVVYIVLRPASALQRQLAWAQVAAFVVGCALIFWPMRVLAGFFFLPSRVDDLPSVFALANRLSSVGYGVSLLGLLIFLCFLLVRAKQGFSARRRQRSG